MTMWIATILNYPQVLFLMVSIACMMICLLIFCLITGINIKASSFTFAIFVMSIANFIIFTQVGSRPFNETCLSSVFTFLYSSHYINRLEAVVEGARLDVAEDDMIYSGLANFMDVPYYVYGTLEFCLPVAKLLGLNVEHGYEQESPKEKKHLKKN